MRSAIALSAACAVAAAASVPSNFPAFDWTTLPIFWHSANSSGPFSAEQLQYIGKRFPLITIEKMMSMEMPPKNTSAETKIVAAARQIKSVNPDAKVMFYLNSIMDWYMYDLHTTMEAHPDWWLRDDDGKFVEVVGQRVFDHSNPDTRAAWLNVLAQAQKSGVIDGAFLDRGNYYGSSVKNLSPARQAAWDKGHDLVEQGAQAIFKDGVVILNNANNANVYGRMYERWGASDYDHGDLLADIHDLQQQSTNFSFPHAAEAHGEPNTENPDVFNATLAAYLVGAGPYAYFACTPGWTVTSGWDIWFPQYDIPLGAPTSDAVAAASGVAVCRDGSAEAFEGAGLTVEGMLGLASARSSEELSAALGGSTACVGEGRGGVASVRSWGTTLKREFESGTKACLSLQSGSLGPGVPCIHWGNGRVDGAAGCQCE